MNRFVILLLALLLIFSVLSLGWVYANCQCMRHGTDGAVIAGGHVYCWMAHGTVRLDDLQYRDTMIEYKPLNVTWY